MVTNEIWQAASAWEVKMGRRRLLELAGRGAMAGALISIPGLLAACQAAATPTAAKLNQLTWALDGEPGSIDPTHTYDFPTLTVGPQLNEGLLRFNSDGTLAPNLAESWRTIDPTTYEYTIRQGVRFHDGSSMSMDDVVYSLNRNLDSKVATLYSGYYLNVKSIDQTGTWTVTVRLKQPDPNWRLGTATAAVAIGSKSFIEKVGDKYGTPAVGVMATGPYKFVSWTPGQEIVLKRHDQHWDQSRLDGPANLTFKIIPDPNTRIAALRTNEVDGTYTLTAPQAASVGGNKAIHSQASTTVQLLEFNIKRQVFSDVRARQALSMALDRNGMVASAIRGKGSVVKSVVAPQYPWQPDKWRQAYDSLDATYVTQNVSAAKGLIAAAGLQGKTAVLLYPGDLSPLPDVALAIQAAGNSIGLNIQLDKRPTAEFLAIIFDPTKWKYDMMINDWLPDTNDPYSTFSLLYETGAGTNFTGYSNKALDSALAAYAALPDATSAQAADALIDVQKTVMTDLTITPLFQQDQVVVLPSNMTPPDMNWTWIWEPWAAGVKGA